MVDVQQSSLCGALQNFLSEQPANMILDIWKDFWAIEANQSSASGSTFPGVRRVQFASEDSTLRYASVLPFLTCERHAW